MDIGNRREDFAELVLEDKSFEAPRDTVDSHKVAEGNRCKSAVEVAVAHYNRTELAEVAVVEDIVAAEGMFADKRRNCIEVVAGTSSRRTAEVAADNPDNLADSVEAVEDMVACDYNYNNYYSYNQVEESQFLLAQLEQVLAVLS